jgi:diguanylate cyclase (GGDEF)-like protein
MTERAARILLMCEAEREAASRSGQFALAGWDVIAVADHIEALAAIRGPGVDVAVFHMPIDDMDAMDLPGVLRQIAPAAYLPVVILAPTLAEEQRCRFLDSGADDVISCATSGAEMVARIGALLRVKHLHDELATSRAALQEALRRERELLAKLKQDNEHLQALATTDPLTHVQNVRSFHDILEHEFKMARRYNHCLSLLMLDLDHFKVVNDTHGHPSGDYVLKELAVILKQSVRDSDVVARTGGEEFSVILPKADPEQSSRFAERIRSEVYRRKFIVYGQQIHITTSIGLATYPSDAEIVEPEMLAYFGDQALLLAKESGRDRVVAVRDLASPTRRRLRQQYLGIPSDGESEQASHSVRHPVGKA